MSLAAERVHAVPGHFAFVAVLLLLAGCGSEPADRSSVGEGEAMFPADRVEDWVSYADQLSLVVVENDAEIPPPESVTSNGEGYIGRTATLRVERTLWTQNDVTAVEGSITFPVAGWILREGRKKTDAAVAGGPRIEVGDRLLIPLARQPDGSLGLMSSSAVLVIRGGVVVLADGQQNPAVEGMVGMTPNAVGELVSAASPDPAALQHWDLPPWERARAVVNDTSG